MKNTSTIAFLMVFSLLLTTACEPAKRNENIVNNEELELIASSPNQWTGIAISSDDRMFVNFPRWSDNVPVSVAEIVEGEVVPFPDKSWNTYADTANSEQQFICVQSVFVDKKDRLWVLDPANPKFQGVVARGPRLHQFDLGSNTLVKSYSFADSTYTTSSYLNDVRIDEERNMALITDSGTGGIVIVNLESGDTYRRLDGHPTTQATTDTLVAGDYVWKGTVHSDGIALSPDRDYLYYAPLSGHRLFRVRMDQLVDFTIDERQLSSFVEKVEDIMATDGMLFGENGNLYLGGLENNSVYHWKSGSPYEQLITNDQIRWADSFAEDDQGYLYFTTSQIHLPLDKRDDYRIYRILE